jgi:hypothetical protein
VDDRERDKRKELYSANTFCAKAMRKMYKK